MTDDENFLKFPKLRHPKIVPIKQNLYQKINNLKPHIWSLSIDFRFSGRKSQSHHKLAKKITHFTIQFCSKISLILRTSTHSKLEKDIPATQ